MIALTTFLEKMRQERAVSQRELAERAKIAGSTYRLIEYDRSEPRLKTLIDLGAVLGFKVMIQTDSHCHMLRMQLANTPDGQKCERVFCESGDKLARHFFLDMLIDKLTPAQRDQVTALMKAMVSGLDQQGEPVEKKTAKAAVNQH